MTESDPITAMRVQEETRALLGTDAGDLSYIDHDLVAADARRADPPEVGGGDTLGEVCYGTNPRWGRIRVDGVTHSVILFDCGDDPSDSDGACSARKTGWLSPNDWTRHLLGSCGGDLRRPRYRFDRKRR